MPETDTNFQKQIESGEEDSYIYIYTCVYVKLMVRCQQIGRNVIEGVGVQAKTD